jgi:hypothetical protein
MLKRIPIVVGCAIATTTATGSLAAPPSFAKDIVPIFRANCTACHMASDEPETFSLAPSSAYAELQKQSFESGLARVQPGKPEQSYLVHKLRGTQAKVGGKGEQMPLGGAPLPAEAVAKITDWIAAGAPNN